MTSKRILVAEDDASIRLLEKKILESAGYQVDCAENGDVALEMVKQERYVLVVADVMMPGINGFELTKRIAELYHRTLPVLLVTAVPDPLNAAHAEDAKPMSTLRKPFTAAALLTAVRLLEAQGKKTPAKEASSPKAPSVEKRSKSWFEKLFHPSDTREKK